jgi:DNA-directed RNA polymerase specialized sigma24 family protein
MALLPLRRPSSTNGALSPEPFERLLTLLDPDRDRAAGRYEDIRWRLRKYFAWRGATFTDELADETMDRVSLRLAAGEHIRAEDPVLYFYGVARNILRESWVRDRRREEAAPIELPVHREQAPEAWPDRENHDGERRIECLQRCLGCLSSSSRRLALAYYEAPGVQIEPRRALAASLGVSLPALRARMHRVRAGLQRCTRGCLPR